MQQWVVHPVQLCPAATNYVLVNKLLSSSLRWVPHVSAPGQGALGRGCVSSQPGVLEGAMTLPSFPLCLNYLVFVASNFTDLG